MNDQRLKTKDEQDSGKELGSGWYEVNEAQDALCVRPSAREKQCLSAKFQTRWQAQPLILRAP